MIEISIEEHWKNLILISPPSFSFFDYWNGKLDDFVEYDYILTY